MAALKGAMSLALDSTDSTVFASKGAGFDSFDLMTGAQNQQNDAQMHDGDNGHLRPPNTDI